MPQPCRFIIEPTHTHTHTSLLCFMAFYIYPLRAKNSRRVLKVAATWPDVNILNFKDRRFGSQHRRAALHMNEAPSATQKLHISL